MLTLGASFHLPSILMSLCSWSSLYLGLRQLEPQRKAEWHCRIITALHASLITVVTGWATFVQGPWPFTDAGGPNTLLQTAATTICLGYFLFDFAWCLYFQTEGFSMLLHHSLSILGFVWSLCAGKYGTELAATICGSEATNPLLQLRWFLKETGRYDTVLGEVVDALFMLSFFLIRIVVGSVLLYCYFQQPTDFMGRVGALAIYLISWVFWVSIFQYAVYKYKKKYRAWTLTRTRRETRVSPSPLSGAERDQEGDDRKVESEEGESSASSENSSNGVTVTSSQVLCKDVSQNGVHHRSGGAGHAGSSGTSATKGTSQEEDVTNGVLING